MRNTRRWKKSISLVLAVLLAMVVLPMAVSAFAADSGFHLEESNYEGQQERALRLRSYSGSSGEVVIPDGVTDVGGYVVWERAEGITSVVVPESVKYIWRESFDLPNLTKVTIMNGETAIEDRWSFPGVRSPAFSNEGKLTIYSHPGGSVEEYAREYGINFVALGATTPGLPSALTVSPTQSKVFINGVLTTFEAYYIEGNNYFKLRDLAFVLNGSNKQFEVGYDNATKAITLISGRSYTPTGNQEMVQGDGSPKSAILNASINITLDGAPVVITAYLIGGNNFMKLRDVMRLLDVGVGYDEVTKNITIDTSRSYQEDDGGQLPVDSGTAGLSTEKPTPGHPVRWDHEPDKTDFIIDTVYWTVVNGWARSSEDDGLYKFLLPPGQTNLGYDAGGAVWHFASEQEARDAFDSNPLPPGRLP